MKISGGSALPKEEIDRMVREAEEHAEEDKKRREEAETRNTAEQLVYSTEKFLADNDDKLPEDGKTEVRSAVDELKTALAGEDIDAVRSGHEKLSAASQKLGTALYEAQAAEQAGGDPAAGDGPSFTKDPGASGTASADDDVVDAEIVDEDGTK
jgi:molecular chaperone DnaK